MADKARNIQLYDNTGEWEVYPITVASEVKYIDENSSNGITTIQEEITNIKEINNSLESRVGRLEDAPEMDAINITYNGENLDTALDSYDARINTLETNGSTTIVNRIREIEKDITSIEGINTSQDTLIGNLNRQLGDVDNRLRDLEDLGEAVNNRQDEEISNINTEITALDNRVTILENTPLVVSLTQEEYDSLPEYRFDVIYCIVDATSTLTDLLRRVKKLEES